MPEFSRGVRWNDDAFKISWPHKVTVISKKYSSFKLYNEEPLHNIR